MPKFDAKDAWVIGAAAVAVFTIDFLAGGNPIRVIKNKYMAAPAAGAV